MTQATTGRRRDALDDSRSVLRQVSGALQDLGVGADGDAGVAIRAASDPGRLPQLASTLIKAYVEINGLIQMLRDSRNVLEKAALHRLQATNEKLQDVTSATESAATYMLDGVDRMSGLLDRLATQGSKDDTTIDEMRDELHMLVMHMQFQDITSQQLGYASSVLVDLEERLQRIAEIFGTDGLTDSEKAEIDQKIEDALESRPTCDPNASLGDADARQSLADSIFG